jgi:hypothetical protein
MQTAVELDEDVRSLLDEEVQRSGEPLTSVVNRLLRSELKPREPFRVKPWDMGLPPEWTSGKVEDLLDLLDGPIRR